MVRADRRLFSGIGGRSVGIPDVLGWSPHRRDRAAPAGIDPEAGRGGPGPTARRSPAGSARGGWRDRTPSRRIARGAAE